MKNNAKKIQTTKTAKYGAISKGNCKKADYGL